jgi:transposase
MRILKLAKGSAVKARVQALNQLRAVLVNADPQLRDALRSLRTQQLIAACAALEVDRGDATATATVHTLRQLGRRIQYLAEEIREFERRIAAAVASTAPRLLDLHGIGPDAAATLLITAGDNPQRLTSEASSPLAHRIAVHGLCGVSPVESSSGKTQRRRLNRGGDRQANAALYRAVLIGLRRNPETREYARRRITEGKTKREIIRCLKRYLARTIYHLIAPTTPRPEPLPTT